MKIFVQSHTQHTVILPQASSQLGVLVRNQSPWGSLWCWKVNHLETFLEFLWPGSGKETNFVVSYTTTHVVPIGIFWTESPKILKILTLLWMGVICRVSGEWKRETLAQEKVTSDAPRVSYSFMEYKPYTQLHRDGAHHSQGREQMHSVLEKLTPSLRHMSYFNFMRTLVLFFSVHNLWTMDKL